MRPALGGHHLEDVACADVILGLFNGLLISVVGKVRHRFAHGIGGDVIMRRADTAAGEDVIHRGRQRADRGHHLGHPEHVRDVVTMGTPIRGREGTEWIVRWFRILNPEAAEDLTPEGAERHAQPLTMPMTAIWSPIDGVVSGPACRVREEDEGPLARNVRVDAAHLGMGFNLDVLRALAQALAAHSAVAAA